jgi:hypothetical protein
MRWMRGVLHYTAVEAKATLENLMRLNFIVSVEGAKPTRDAGEAMFRFAYLHIQDACEIFELETNLRLENWDNPVDSSLVVKSGLGLPEDDWHLLTETTAGFGVRKPFVKGEVLLNDYADEDPVVIYLLEGMQEEGVLDVRRCSLCAHGVSGCLRVPVCGCVGVGALRVRVSEGSVVTSCLKASCCFLVGLLCLCTDFLPLSSLLFFSLFIVGVVECTRSSVHHPAVTLRSFLLEEHSVFGAQTTLNQRGSFALISEYTAKTDCVAILTKAHSLSRLFREREDVARRFFYAVAVKHAKQLIELSTRTPLSGSNSSKKVMYCSRVFELVRSLPSLRVCVLVLCSLWLLWLLLLWLYLSIYLSIYIICVCVCVCVGGGGG